MIMAMKIKYMPVLLLIIGVISLCNMVCAVDSTNLADECSDSFEKVMDCLSYATGKSMNPSKECCTSVGEIRDSQPVCLCYIVLENHKGSSEMKSLGILESRLLTLSSACKLFNASVSDCPKLLNILESSPDYKIFNNTNTTTSNTPPSGGGGSGSTGFKHGPDYQLVGLVLAVFMAIFCSVIPEGYFTP